MDPSVARLGLAAILIAPILAAPPGFAQPLFDAPYYIHDGIRADDLKTADLNGDGDQDLVVVDGAAEMLRVYSNQDGRFLLVDLDRAFVTPRGCDVAEMNGDTSLDVVVICPYSYVNVFLNSGTGSMSRLWYELYSEPGGGFAVGDVDGDGPRDVIGLGLGDEEPPTLRLARGVGNGSLLAQTSLAIADSTVRANDVLLGDLDLDDRLDIVLSGEGPVYRMLGNGDGSFQQPVQIPTGPADSGPIALADLSGDEILDLAILWGPNLTVLLGDGQGGFGAPLSPAQAIDAVGKTLSLDVAIAPSLAAVTTQTLAVGDVDADGDPDLVASIGTGATVFRNAGSGVFGPGISYPAGGSAPVVALLDIDGDALLDILLPQPTQNRLVELRNRGGGDYGSDVRSYAMGPDPKALLVVDLDGDGWSDVVAANPNWGQLSVRLGTSSGDLGDRSVVVTGGEPAGLAGGDLDADGDVDLVAASRGDSRLRVVLGNGDGTFVFSGQYPTGQLPEDVALADFDFDGDLDVAVADPGAPGSTEFFVPVRLGNGDGTFGSTVYYQTSGRSADVAVGDLNEDGRPDLAAACGTPDRIAVFLGVGDGTFAPAGEVAAGGGPKEIVLADTDGDGHLDVVVANSTGSGVTRHLGAGDGTLGPAEAIPVGGAAVDLDAGDLDRDGDLDLAVLLGAKKVVSVLEGVATGFASLPTFRVDSPVDSKLGRVDGDALLDLVVADDLWDKIFIFRNVTPGAPTDAQAEQAPGPAPLALHVPRVAANGAVRIAFALARPEPARLSVFDVRGRRLWSIAVRPDRGGEHAVVWDRRDMTGWRVPRGVYCVQLATPANSMARKLPLLRP